MGKRISFLTVLQYHYYDYRVIMINMDSDFGTEIKTSGMIQEEASDYI